MLIKYFNNPELAYTTRKRYGNFSFEPFYQEEQRSVLLGDGATTQIKTKKSNICNYVMIDNTRWYVTHYIYMNGGQVTLYLQRDVIGEFGIEDCFGQIERGYTDSILKNRKELSLNQILKERKQLKPNTTVYGNYYLQPIDSSNQDVHKDEIWGLIYMVKPAEGQVVIPIPAFTPEVVDYDFIPNNTVKNVSYNTENCYLFIPVQAKNSRSYSVEIRFGVEDAKWVYKEANVVYVDGQYNNPIIIDGLSDLSSTRQLEKIKQIFEEYGQYLFYDTNMITFPSLPSLDSSIPDYNNITIKKDDTYYAYKMQNIGNEYYGIIKEEIDVYNNLKSFIEDVFGNQVSIKDLYTNIFDWQLYTTLNQVKYTYTILTGGADGNLTIDTTKQQLIDEPYYVLAFPLFNTTIKGSLDGKTYKIDRDKAFNIFNTVIQTLSGDNGYLIDAQIYPYCPILIGVTAEINGYPFFTINSTSYTYDCKIQLFPSSDVKKEYIERVYSIISPEQSSKFDFNFYDYITEVKDVNGVNYAEMTIKVKTALKPYAIISSAVIQANENSLMGIMYSSDLRGSQPSSNGFECSLVSNAFETYKRQNSNYQQIFNLDKEELQKQHSVELVNDITSTVINTASATAMGAMAGASMADTGIWGSISGSKAVGAGIGAGVTGATVGAAMVAQTIVNNDLRNYEESLQQQRFDLNIGTVKNLPNSVNRISSFNEIILQDFWYIVEIYDCSNYEKLVVDNFIKRYGYGIGVFDYVVNYQKDGWFLRSTLISSSYAVNLHQIAEKELMGGIYYYEQS